MVQSPWTRLLRISSVDRMSLRTFSCARHSLSRPVHCSRTSEQQIISIPASLLKACLCLQNGTKVKVEYPANLQDNKSINCTQLYLTVFYWPAFSVWYRTAWGLYILTLFKGPRKWEWKQEFNVLYSGFDKCKTRHNVLVFWRESSESSQIQRKRSLECSYFYKHAQPDFRGWHHLTCVRDKLERVAEDSEAWDSFLRPVIYKLVSKTVATFAAKNLQLLHVFLSPSCLTSLI